ncbi:MAG: glycosyltransferase [Actinomycetota bacterium]|nr:glycosyltransferase [Actinomycetota bacterium]
MSPPLVSVCVATRNQAAYLGGALASALTQDVELEVLVHDDASADGTESVVKEIADPRVRYLRHERPLGVAPNRNTCLAHARGRYVAWLDSDDEYLQGMLALQVGVLEASPGIGLVHGGFHVIGADGERLRDWPAPLRRDTVEPAHQAFRNLIASNEVTTSTVVIRRSCHEAMGGFRPGVGASSSDWDAWLRIALRTDVAYTAVPVSRYRQHAATISRGTSATGERLRCDVAVVRSVLSGERSRIPDPRRAAAIAGAALAGKALAHAGDLQTRGHRRESMRAVALAARLAPRPLARFVPRLVTSTARGDAYGCYRTNKAMLARLADVLEGTRHGERVRASAAVDSDWEAVLARAADAVRRVVPADACVGAVTKWDPTLLALSARRGRNFPDRRRLPDGYPRDGDAAVAHLEDMRGDGISHLVLPSASFWWLEHYPALARHLEERAVRLWRDEDCLIYELRASP